MMDKSTQLTKSMSKISLRKGGGAKKICIEDLIGVNSPLLEIDEADKTSDLQKIQCDQHTKMPSSKWCICNTCGKTLSSYQTLWKHKKSCKADGALVGQKRSASAMDTTTDIPKRSDDTEEITGATIEPQPKKRYRPRMLISTKEFDKLVQKPAVEWSSLTPNTIYKLVWVYARGNGKVIGNLEDGTGSIISTWLPRFVVKRLLEITTKPGTNTFIRPMGDEEVDIAVAAKLACTKCKKEFTSPTYLDRHILLCGMKGYHCSHCKKELSSYHSLWKHKKQCMRQVTSKSSVGDSCI